MAQGGLHLHVWGIAVWSVEACGTIDMNYVMGPVNRQLIDTYSRTWNCTRTNARALGMVLLSSVIDRPLQLLPAACLPPRIQSKPLGGLTTQASRRPSLSSRPKPVPSVRPCAFAASRLHSQAGNTAPVWVVVVRMEEG